MAVPSSLQERRPGRIYFAFGSNLHLGQMAKRCPESRYIGTGILHDYRFQINQRGFANVLHSLGNHVEGLFYLISQTNEGRLDRSEGVPTSYQKKYLTVEVFTAAVAYVGRAVPELAQRLAFSGLHTTESETSTKSPSSHDRSRSNTNLHTSHTRGVWPSKTWRHVAGELKQRVSHHQVNVYSATDTQAGAVCAGLRQPHRAKGQTIEALVYVSENSQNNGKPRDEYIDRMNAGIIDARKLGISDLYIDNCLRRHIINQQLPKQDYAFAQQRSPEGRKYLPSRLDPAGNDLPDESSRTRHESKIRTISAQVVEDEVQCQPKYTSLGNSRDTDFDRYYREGRPKQESTPPRSSATDAQDKKGPQLKHKSSEDISNSEFDSYYPEDRRRRASTAPRISASAVEDRKRQQPEHKGSETTRNSRLDPVIKDIHPSL